MKGLREIKQRIKAVKNISQITRAMQLVAASKMKRAQDNAIGNRDYTLILEEIVSALIHEVEDVNHPLFNPRPVKSRGIILIATDRGLCGSLNNNLFKTIHQVEDSAQFVAVGRKATQYLARAKRNLLADFSTPDPAPFKAVKPIAYLMLDLYKEEKIDTIEIAYAQYINPLVQKPVIEPIIPLANLKETLEDLRTRFKIKDTDYLKDTRRFALEPSPEELLAKLPELLLRHSIYHNILESRASEHSARMVAMKNATENAKNLNSELTLEFNKARQAAITQEILEISSAASSA